MTLVSVVTICRNDLDGLRRTVASVQSQSHTGIQHIIVDAASTDGSVEYIKTLIDQAQIISEPDEGRYDGMNKGARIAEGQLLWFMHAGDEFGSAQSVEHVVAAYEEEPFRWGYGLARLINDDRDVVALQGSVPFRFDRFALGGRPIPHQASVFETDFFHDLGDYSLEFGIAEDQHFLLKAANTVRPRTFAEFLCTFDEGGIGRSRGIMPHYKDMARGRALENITVFKSPLIDRALSYWFAAVAAIVGKAAAKSKRA